MKWTSVPSCASRTAALSPSARNGNPETARTTWKDNFLCFKKTRKQESKQTTKQQWHKAKCFAFHQTNGIVLRFAFLPSCFQTTHKENHQHARKAKRKANNPHTRKAKRKANNPHAKKETRKESNKTTNKFGTYFNFDYICAMIAALAWPAQIDWKKWLSHNIC